MDSPIRAAADPRRRLALVAAVYLGSFIATLDVSIVNVALPRCSGRFPPTSPGCSG